MSQSYVIMRLHIEPRPGPVLRRENICLIPVVSANQLFGYQLILKALSPFGNNLLIRVHFPVQIQRENQYHYPLESHHVIRIRKEIALQYDFSYKIQRSCEMANLFFLLFPSLLPILSIYSHDIGLIVTGQDYETIDLSILATLSECCEMRDRMDGVRISPSMSSRLQIKRALFCEPILNLIGVRIITSAF